MSELPPINPTATANPLGGLVPLLGGGETADEGYYATVVSIEPLRIQLDATDGIADVTPISLVSRLTPGNRVYAVRKGRQLVVVGRIQPALVKLEGGVNLNTLTSSGEYYVIGNGNASTTNNFPVGYAGRLTVSSIADGFAEQTYRVWISASGISRMFTRDLYAGTWRPWVEHELWTPWTNLALSNGWTNTGSGSDPLAYRQSGLRVELRGAVSPGTLNSTLATLPSDARPSSVRWIRPTAWTGQTTAWRVNVNTNGTIATMSAASGLSWLGFDGVTFSL